tara:strand:+ start:148 stop:384 length:237 start_codon:yes stop_codon:yes gene_type:complete
VAISHRFHAIVVNPDMLLIEIEANGKMDPHVMKLETVKELIKKPEKIQSEMPAPFVRSTGDVHELLSCFYRFMWELDH